MHAWTAHRTARSRSPCVGPASNDSVGHFPPKDSASKRCTDSIGVGKLKELNQIPMNINTKYHLYADDTQLCISQANLNKILKK